MRTIEFKVYKIDEHPNKEKCFEWIRNNWHDLNQHTCNDIIDSIKALSNKIGGTVNYSISQTPDRGEFITFKDYDHQELCYISGDDYPLTGVCWDDVVIRALRCGDTRKILEALHNDTEYIYSDEGLYELCVANDYEFYENGKCL